MHAEHLAGIELRHRFAQLNGIRLHWVEAGSGPLVVLLHGFPDFWYVWREQIPALVAAGRRVVAPDLRGYNESERPLGWRNYTPDLLATDIEELIALVSAEGDGGPALLVGHDWGGMVAWRVAARAPAALGRVAILNAPHPRAFLREVRRPPQLFKSWYAVAFQLPWLPEAALGSFDLAPLRAMWRASAGRRGISDTDLARHHAVFAQPGAIGAALAYYRAAARRTRSAGGTSRVSLPTLVVWGERDPALSVRLTEGLERWVPDVRLEVLERTGHWPQLERPEAVNRLLLDFGEASPLAGRSGAA